MTTALRPLAGRPPFRQIRQLGREVQADCALGEAVLACQKVAAAWESPRALAAVISTSWRAFDARASRAS